MTFDGDSSSFLVASCANAQDVGKKRERIRGDPSLEKKSSLCISISLSFFFLFFFLRTGRRSPVAFAPHFPVDGTYYYRSPCMCNWPQ